MKKCLLFFEKGAARDRHMTGFSSLLSRLFLVSLFALTAGAAWAQPRTVTGTVSDEQGQPVIGAGVIVAGTTIGTYTNQQGNFTLSNVQADANITVDYLGYVSQTIPVAGQGVINITLLEDMQTLDEVIVIGYGSVKKSSLTSAVSKMNAEALADRPLARPENALQGQLAGVTVRTTSGEPGADMQIRVRGAASINAKSDPLYVVDGIPMTTLTGINPADIESIEVLKAAASAAIYGSRGSNGVVIVSTKKGKSGKPLITFNASVGVQTLEKKIDVLSAVEWMEYRTKWNDANYLTVARNRGVANASITDNNAQRLINVGKAGGQDAGITLDPRWFNYMSEEMRQSHAGQYTPSDGTLDLLDWQKEFYQPAIVQDYNVNVTGGNDNTSYMFSGGYFDQEGLAHGTNYKRYSFRTNIESTINKYVMAGMSLAPSFTVSNGSGRANAKDSRAHHALSFAPVSEAGVGYDVMVQPNTQYEYTSAGNPSPIAFMNNILRIEDLRMVASAFLRIKPMDGLQVEFSGSANYFDRDRMSYNFSRNTTTWAAGEGANSSSGHDTERTWGTLMQALANYDKTFGKHTIGLMAGASSEESNVGFTTAQAFNKPFPNDMITGTFDESTSAVGNSNVTQKTPNRLVSAFGRVNYSFDERYMISASLRYDGGSVFGMKNHWGSFPAVSAGWLVSNEEFFKDLGLNWLNTLKLRASYGMTGNNSIDATAAYPTMSSVSYAGQAGYNANSLGNADLGWEKTHSTDVAIDLGLLKNRIQLSVDWYTKTTKALLYRIPVADASGFSAVTGNLGELSNKGLDIELNTANLTGALKWNTSLNVSYNQNEVNRIGYENTPVYSGFDGSAGNYSNVLAIGHPINAFYMYETIGVWKSQAEIDAYTAAHGTAPKFQGTLIKPGDLRMRDVDGDGNITTGANIGEGDKVFLGSPTPTMFYGMTNTFNYKNFDLSILLTAQTGGMVYGAIGRAIDRPNMGAASNVQGNWRNAWWSESETGDGKTPYIMSTTTGAGADSRWLHSSDYLRIKNLTLGYMIPINKNIISSARIYISIENLAKWDSYYHGYSPESANTQPGNTVGGANSLGIDYGGYPMPRIFSAGLNLTF
jgi:TonB-linked SusC/RagA family outer membrane protein